MKAIVYYLTREASLQRQRQAVKTFVHENGYEFVSELVEHGEGTGRQAWPVLKSAVEKAKKLEARLIIAKLGRLKWNLAFLRALEGSRSTASTTI